MVYFLLFITILPIVGIAYYVYNKDEYKEPKALLLKLFIGGIVSCTAVLTLSTLLSTFFPLFAEDPSNLKGLSKLVSVFIGIALVEEGCKYYFLYTFSFNNVEFDHMFDMIVYSVFISLGFAFLENLFYVDGTILTSILRGVTAVPMHVSCGIFMGIFLAKAKYAKANKTDKYFINAFLSLLIPFLIHGLYDYSIYVDGLLALIFFFIILISTVVVSLILLNNKSKSDTEIF